MGSRKAHGTRVRLGRIWRRRVAVTACATGMMTLIMPLTTATATSLVTAAPVLVNPTNNATVSANPVFSWQSVTGALEYEIKVATDAGFSSVVYQATTYQLDATPTSDLPTSTLYWEVAGVDTNGQSGPYAASQFSKSSLPGPTLSTPANGASLQYPTAPLLFSWQPLAGSASYKVEVSSSPTFSTENSYTTDNTSYALTDPQAAGTYYWRVQGISSTSSVVSQWSNTGDYTIAQLVAPTLSAPANNSTVTDVVLSWVPLAGAAKYELEVSPNITFSNNITLDTTIESTQYSPSTTFYNGS